MQALDRDTHPLDRAAFYSRTYREQLRAVLGNMRPNVYGLGSDHPSWSRSQITYARAEANRRTAQIINEALA